MSPSEIAVVMSPLRVPGAGVKDKIEAKMMSRDGYRKPRELDTCLREDDGAHDLGDDDDDDDDSSS